MINDLRVQKINHVTKHAFGTMRHVGKLIPAHGDKVVRSACGFVAWFCPVPSVDVGHCDRLAIYLKTTNDCNE